MSIGVLWQEGPFEVNVLSVKASKNVMERSDMYYERFMTKSESMSQLGCNDDISAMIATAQFAKNQNYPDLGVSIYTALATQFSLGDSCAPAQKGLVLSALEESRVTDSMTAGFNTLELAFQEVLEWDSNINTPIQLLVDGGNNGWDEQSWNLVLDSVMGGRSRGSLSFSDGSLLLSGTINLIGGGVVQIEKNFPETDFSSADGFILEVKALDPAVARAPLALKFAVQDSTSRYLHTVPLVVPFTSSSGSLDTFLVGAKWDSFVGRRYGGKCTSGCQLNPSRIRKIVVGVVYQEGPFEFELVSIAAATGILGQQDMYAALLESHPSYEVLQSKVDVVLHDADYMKDHGFTDFAVALMSTFGRQLLGAEGSASFDEEENNLFSHFVAAQGAPTASESVYSLRSGIISMEGSSNDGIDENDGEDLPSGSSSRNSGVVYGLAVGVGVFVAIVAFVFVKQNARLNIENGEREENSSERSDDTLLVKEGTPIVNVEV
jgi:hypothetical protein